jgi:hypothetical protein
MRQAMLNAGLTLTVLTAGASGAQAQRVSADIHLGGVGPVSGTIRIGDRYDRPARRVVMVREYPGVVVVHSHRGRGWGRRAAAVRVVDVWYDADCGLYFDRYRRGLVQVRVVEREGRFYRYDPRYDGRIRDRHDRYDRFDTEPRCAARQLNVSWPSLPKSQPPC